VQLDRAAAAVHSTLLVNDMPATPPTASAINAHTHSPCRCLYLARCPPQSQSDPARSAAVYEALKDDAELAPVFEDVKANGPAALQK
jgi:hypothetical protein